MSDIRAELMKSREGFIRSVSEAETWVSYTRDALAYYDEWLADPNLEPPFRDFPTFKPQNEPKVTK